MSRQRRGALIALGLVLILGACIGTAVWRAEQARREPTLPAAEIIQQFAWELRERVGDLWKARAFSLVKAQYAENRDAIRAVLVELEAHEETIGLEWTPWNDRFGLLLSDNGYAEEPWSADYPALYELAQALEAAGLHCTIYKAGREYYIPVCYLWSGEFHEGRMTRIYAYFAEENPALEESPNHAQLEEDCWLAMEESVIDFCGTES